MKYEIETIVKVPIEEFMLKFQNPESFHHWQRGLIGVEHISGHPRKQGSRMKLVYKMGKRKMEIIETIEENDLPRLFHARYHTKGMDNFQENYFEKLSDGNTKWKSKNEFFPLNLSMRLFMIFMPKAFKKQSKIYMKDFKNYVERGISVKSVH